MTLRADFTDFLKSFATKNYFLEELGKKHSGKTPMQILRKCAEVTFIVAIALGTTVYNLQEFWNVVLIYVA